jgi:pilus assembly protein CpaF
LHANTAADVVARFEALGALAGLAPAAVHAQLLSAVQVVVHVRRQSRRRFVDTVAVLTRGPQSRPEVSSALMTNADGATVIGPAWPVLAALLDLPGSLDPADSLDPAESLSFRPGSVA